MKSCNRDFLKNHSPEEGVLNSDYWNGNCCETADVAFGDLGWGGVGSDRAFGKEFRLQEL